VAKSSIDCDEIFFKNQKLPNQSPKVLGSKLNATILSSVTSPTAIQAFANSGNDSIGKKRFLDQKTRQLARCRTPHSTGHLSRLQPKKL